MRCLKSPFFKVVTNCKSSEEVSTRIERFLLEFRPDLEGMSKETYMENVKHDSNVEKCESNNEI